MSNLTEHLRVVNGENGDDLFNLINLTRDMNINGLPGGLEPINHLQIKARDYAIVELSYTPDADLATREAARNAVIQALTKKRKYQAELYTPEDVNEPETVSV